MSEQAILEELQEQTQQLRTLARLVTGLITRMTGSVPGGAQAVDDTTEAATWILTDAHVARVERAVREEQEGRGRALGG